MSGTKMKAGSYVIIAVIVIGAISIGIWGAWHEPEDKILSFLGHMLFGALVTGCVVYKVVLPAIRFFSPVRHADSPSPPTPVELYKRRTSPYMGDHHDERVCTFSCQHRMLFDRYVVHQGWTETVTLFDETSTRARLLNFMEGFEAEASKSWASVNQMTLLAHLEVGTIPSSDYVHRDLLMFLRHLCSHGADPAVRKKAGELFVKQPGHDVELDEEELDEEVRQWHEAFLIRQPEAEPSSFDILSMMLNSWRTALATKKAIVTRLRKWLDEDIILLPRERVPAGDLIRNYGSLNPLPEGEPEPTE